VIRSGRYAKWAVAFASEFDVETELCCEGHRPLRSPAA